MRSIYMWVGSLLLATSVSATTSNETLTFDGAVRGYILQTPASYSPTQPAPLVIALHGAGGSGTQFFPNSGWIETSEQYGLIVAFPDGGTAAGPGFTWNSYDFSGSAPRDLAFLMALIDAISVQLNIDARRVYLTGFSNGAMMTNSFACAHADRLAAIGPVSGGWMTAYGTPESQCLPSRNLPTWIWRGQNENFSTGIGGNAAPRGEQDRAQLAFWRAANEATAPGKMQTVTGNYGGVTRTYLDEIYEGQATVRFTEVVGTSHQYQPGAADRLWTQFFSAHTLGDELLFADGFETWAASPY